MLKTLQSLSPVKIISAIVAFFLAVILLVNILIVVDPEERAVEVCLGDISQTVMEPGRVGYILVISSCNGVSFTATGNNFRFLFRKLLTCTNYSI